MKLWMALLVSSLMVLHSSEALAASLDVKATAIRWNRLVVPAAGTQLVAYPDRGLRSMDDLVKAGKKLGLTPPNPEKYLSRQYLYEGRLIVEESQAEALRKEYREFFRRLEDDARKRDPRQAVTGQTDSAGRAYFGKLAPGPWIITGTFQMPGAAATWSVPLQIREGANYLELSQGNSGTLAFPPVPPVRQGSVYTVTSKGQETAAMARQLLTRVDERYQQERRVAQDSVPLAFASQDPWVFTTLGLWLGSVLAVAGGLVVYPTWLASTTNPTADHAAINSFALNYGLVTVGLVGTGLGMFSVLNASQAQRNAAAKEVTERYTIYRGLTGRSDDKTLIETIYRNPDLRDRLNSDALAR